MALSKFFGPLLCLVGLVAVANASIIGGVFSSRIILNQPSMIKITYGYKAHVPELSHKADYFINLPRPVHGSWSNPYCVLIENDTEDEDTSKIVVHELKIKFDKSNARIRGNLKLDNRLTASMFSFVCTINAPEELPSKGNAGGEINFDNLESGVSAGTISLPTVSYSTYASDTSVNSSGSLTSAGNTGGTRISLRHTTSVGASLTLTSPEVTFALLPDTLPEDSFCNVQFNGTEKKLNLKISSTQSAALVLPEPIPQTNDLHIHCPKLVLAKLKPGVPAIMTVAVDDSTSTFSHESRSSSHIRMDNSAALMSVTICALLSVVVSVANLL